MKKWNADKITTILNKRMAAGIGYGRMSGHFEANGTWILCADIDRGERQDHGGGENGDDWMNDEQIDKQHDYFTKKYQKSLDFIQSTLKEAGYPSSVVYISIETKGFVSIEVGAGRDAKIDKSKDAPKESAPKHGKATAKPMGIIETIRTSIFTERLTKIEILEILTSTFPEKDSSKMAKTISAQLPSRIVKSGQEMDAKKNVKGIQTYKLFTK